jgi:hypothetical protein
MPDDARLKIGSRFECYCDSKERETVMQGDTN